MSVESLGYCRLENGHLIVPFDASLEDFVSFDGEPGLMTFADTPRGRFFSALLDYLSELEGDADEVTLSIAEKSAAS